MSKEYNELKHMFDNEQQIRKIDGTWYYVKDNEIKGFVSVNSILQALQEPTLEELKEQIITELNEYFRIGYEGYDILIDVIFLETKNRFVLLKGNNRHSLASSTEYGVSITRKIPRKSAHKITTYFMRLERPNIK